MTSKHIQCPKCLEFAGWYGPRWNHFCGELCYRCLTCDYARHTKTPDPKLPAFVEIRKPVPMPAPSVWHTICRRFIRLGNSNKER